MMVDSYACCCGNLSWPVHDILDRTIVNHYSARRAGRPLLKERVIGETLA